MSYLAGNNMLPLTTYLNSGFQSGSQTSHEPRSQTTPMAGATSSGRTTNSTQELTRLLNAIMRREITEDDFATPDPDAEQLQGASGRTRRGPVGTSSRFRGVTRHRRTKRWEAHIWDNKKQVYLGGFNEEEHAAKAHDVMALKCRGATIGVNFNLVLYDQLLPLIAKLTREDVVRMLRRQSKNLSKAEPPPAAKKGAKSKATAAKPAGTSWLDSDTDLLASAASPVMSYSGGVLLEQQWPGSAQADTVMKRIDSFRSTSSAFSGGELGGNFPQLPGEMSRIGSFASANTGGTGGTGQHAQERFEIDEDLLALLQQNASPEDSSDDSDAQHLEQQVADRKPAAVIDLTTCPSPRTSIPGTHMTRAAPGLSEGVPMAYPMPSMPYGYMMWNGTPGPMEALWPPHGLPPGACFKTTPGAPTLYLPNGLYPAAPQMLGYCHPSPSPTMGGGRMGYLQMMPQQGTVSALAPTSAMTGVTTSSGMQGMMRTTSSGAMQGMMIGSVQGTASNGAVKGMPNSAGAAPGMPGSPAMPSTTAAPTSLGASTTMLGRSRTTSMPSVSGSAAMSGLPTLPAPAMPSSYHSGLPTSSYMQQMVTGYPMTGNAMHAMPMPAFMSSHAGMASSGATHAGYLQLPQASHHQGMAGMSMLPASAVMPRVSGLVDGTQQPRRSGRTEGEGSGRDAVEDMLLMDAPVWMSSEPAPGFSGVNTAHF